MMSKFSGSKLASSIFTELSKLDIKPKLGIIQIGQNPASNLYIKYKIARLNTIGWPVEHLKLEANSTIEDLSQYITTLSSRSTGLIIQLPLPEGIDKSIINKIPAEKDVDGLTLINQGKLIAGDLSGLVPCTPLACIRILAAMQVDLKGRRVCIFGKSPLVGVPLALLLLREGASVTIINRNDPNPADISRKCDIVISAIGKKHYITQDFVNPNAIVVDIGTTIVDGKSYGDIAPGVSAAYVTPHLGTVGPMTIACLGQNLAAAYMVQNAKRGFSG